MATYGKTVVKINDADDLNGIDNDEDFANDTDDDIVKEKQHILESLFSYITSENNTILYIFIGICIFLLLRQFVLCMVVGKKGKQKKRR